MTEQIMIALAIGVLLFAFGYVIGYGRGLDFVSEEIEQLEKDVERILTKTDGAGDDVL